ncbi:hypothetical protein [Bifidobacterium boum]|uniref:hypothetical protein n=1 Tax=Bifidobacterium boum TaxID=78343 RepID=UPI003F9207F4
MGRPSNERLEELIHASWRDLTQSGRRSAMRELRRRVNDPGMLVFVEDLLSAYPGLSALEALDKEKGLHETEQRATMVYGKDAVKAANQPVDAGSDAGSGDGSDAGSDAEWLDELPADEYQGSTAALMVMIAKCRQHPGKWRRLSESATRKQAQTRAASIRRNKKAWAGFDARAIDHNQRHETWISYQGWLSYQGDAK